MRVEFRRTLLAVARSTLGTIETAPNSGPEIDQWLQYVHAKPGDPWCPAWVCAMHRITAVQFDVANPCPRTDGVHAMWDRTPPECVVTLPFPGCVYFLDHGKGLGHCGIVEVVSPGSTVVTEFSGNTNAEGSREGNQVAEHYGPPELSHRGRLMGYADYAELLPE